MFGGVPFGGGPFCSGPLVDASSPAPFTLHLAEVDRDDIYLLLAYPRNSSGVPVEFRFLDREWIGKPMIEARLLRAIEIQGSISSGFASGGGGVPQVGEIRIGGNTREDSDRLDIDYLADYTWDGAEIEIRLGAPYFSYNQFQPVFRGRAIDLIRDDEGASILIGDPNEALEIPIQAELYGGTGGLDGDARLANTPKPQLWGVCRNIQPILIDRTNNVYQFHYRSAQALLGLFERADATFASAGDVADVYAWTPVGGQYVTNLVNGVFRLGAPPQGTITIDAQGDDVGGYVESSADIVDRICRDIAGSTDSDLDLPSFAQLNTDLPAAIGYYTGQQNPTVRQVVDAILGQGSPRGIPLGFSAFNRLGELRVGIHKFRSPVATIRAHEIVSAPRERTQAAFWRWKIGYRRSWVVQGEDDYGAGATSARKDFVSQEFRSVLWEDTATRDAHGNANRAEINTLLDVQTDAQSEADRAGALTKVDRDFFRSDVKDHQWTIQMGDTVTFEKSDEWDIDAGDYLVLSLGEDGTNGLTSLGIWG